jgi:hypothetical protein
MAAHPGGGDVSAPSITNPIIAIDPGPTVSAYVLLDKDGRYKGGETVANDTLRRLCAKGFEEQRERFDDPSEITKLAIEIFGNMGKHVGAEVFETAYWIGRFVERLHHAFPYSGGVVGLKRHYVKKHFQVPQGANDADVRAAITEQWGGVSAAKGTKEHPGPLYGCTTHQWSALAVAIAYREQGAERLKAFVFPR